VSDEKLHPVGWAIVLLLFTPVGMCVGLPMEVAQCSWGILIFSGLVAMLFGGVGDPSGMDFDFDE
jgi:uncharacterized membrane protein YeiH